MFEYEQRTGKLFQDGTLLGTGYAGHPPHVNDPTAQDQHNVGPIPQGTYTIGPAFTHPMAGPVTMRLTPDPSNNMFGRDGFMIHGDTPALNQSASDGCIILAHAIRTILALATDRTLHVAAGQTGYKPDYAALWASCTLTRAQQDATAQAAQLIAGNKDRYDALDNLTGIPWWWIGAIHYREASCDFTSHLHNGDPLTDYTVNVPAMHPANTGHPPPFTWEESAQDALMLYAGQPPTTWTIPYALEHAELYNGMGYRNLHQMPSPYVWGGTSVQQPGKYVADGKFDPTQIDHQLGVAAIWKALDIT